MPRNVEITVTREMLYLVSTYRQVILDQSVVFNANKLPIAVK